MLTGRVAFAAATVTDTLAAVLDREPDWSVLPDKTPPAIRKLLRRCLEKDPKLRLRDIGDARLDVIETLTLPSATTLSSGADQRARRKLVAGLAASLALGAIATGALVWNLKEGATPQLPPAEVRFSIDAPPMPTPHSMAISPDGRTLVLAATARSNNPNALPLAIPEARLFVRRLGSLQSYPLAGTEGAYHPFWSPDSRYIAFGTGGKLKVIDVNGGEPRPLCDLPSGVVQGGTWSSDNVVVFSSGGTLYRVSAAGGQPMLLARPNRSLGQQNFRWPQFLPDGRRYLYRVGSLQPSRRAVLIGALDSPDTIKVLEGESNAAYAPPNFLVFTRRQTLHAQRFDLSTMTLLGEPVVLGEDVLQEANGSAAFVASASGALAYRTGGSRSLVWIDRTGSTSDTVGALDADHVIELSPDGKRVAFHEPRGMDADDIYVYDLERKVTTRLTNDPGTDHFAVWSPDGLRVAFGYHGTNQVGKDDHDHDHFLYERRIDGATPQRILVPFEPSVAGEQYYVRDWMADFMVYERRKANVVDLWAVPSSGDRKPFRYFQNSSGLTSGRLSPNGRWLAYDVNEGGVGQIVVQSFPNPSQSRHQISSTGGSAVRWRGDGRELFYVDVDQRLVAVSVVTDGVFKIVGSKALFTAPTNLYDVTADGQRFLFNVPSSTLKAPPPINVLLNWTTGLK